MKKEFIVCPNLDNALELGFTKTDSKYMYCVINNTIYFKLDTETKILTPCVYNHTSYTLLARLLFTGKFQLQELELPLPTIFNIINGGRHE